MRLFDWLALHAIQVIPSRWRLFLALLPYAGRHAYRDHDFGDRP